MTLALTGLVAAGIVLVPFARSALRRKERVGGGAGKPSRLPSQEEDVDVAAMMMDDGDAHGLRTSCDAGKAGGLSSMAAHQGIAHAADDCCDEGNQGWTEQTSVSPSRSLEEEEDEEERDVEDLPPGVGYRARFGISPPSQQRRSMDEEEEVAPITASVATAAKPTSLDDLKFTHKDIDL